MLLALADHANDEGACYPSVIGLAKKCAISERNAQLLLRELESSGELLTELSAGRGHKNLYWVLPPETRLRVTEELSAQLEKVKSSDEKVKISALLEKVKSSAEKVKVSAQKVKSSAQKVKRAAPKPSVTIKEPNNTPTAGEAQTSPPAPLPLAVGGEDLGNQDLDTGAADAARGNTLETPPVQNPVQPTANGRGTIATRLDTDPAPGAPVENPVDNLPETPSRVYILGYFGPEFLGRLLDGDPSRVDWCHLPVDLVQQLKDDAVAETKGPKWKVPLIALLDREAANIRRARRPTPAAAVPARSITDTINARIAATRRAE
jgi:Helix-turn-helix domain